MIARELPEGSYAAKKLADLTLLYEEYERRIAGKYTDSEEDPAVAADSGQ